MQVNRAIALAAGAVACLAGVFTSCTTSYSYEVQVARVEGDPQRYTIHELKEFPPPARKVHPATACNEEDGRADEDFHTRLMYTKAHDAVVFHAECGSAVDRDKSRDRCYQLTLDAPAQQPLPVPCGDYWRGDYELADHGHPGDRYNGGWTVRSRLPLSEAQLQVVASNNAVPSSWSLFGGFLLGGGVKGPYSSRIEVFDTRLNKRILDLTTTKGLLDVRPAVLSLGRRSRIVALLGPSRTAVIDIRHDQADYSGAVVVRFASDAAIYRPGSNVRLSATLLSPTGPPLSAVNATVTLQRSRTLPPEGISAEKLDLVSRTAEADGSDIVVYRLHARSTLPAVTPAVRATCRVAAPDMTSLDGCQAGLGTVAPNATAVSSELLRFRVRTGQPVNLSQLLWTFHSTEAMPDPIPLSDTAAWEPAAGNGTFVAEASGLPEGTYMAVLNASNASAATPAFSRTAAATFRVLGAAATVLGVRSQMIDSNANGSPDQLRLSFSVRIPVDGSYELHCDLVGAAGKPVDVLQRAMLRARAAPQTISVDVPADQLADLADAGGKAGGGRAETLAVRNVKLSWETIREKLLHQEIADLGRTVPVPLSSLDRAPVYVTGLAAEPSGVNTNGRPGFEFLRVPLRAITPAGQCFWKAQLFAPDGGFLAFFQTQGFLRAGPNTLVLDFDGGVIHRSGQNGPYKVDKIEIECLTASHQAEQEFRTSAFSAAQFENVRPAFQLTAEYPSVRMAAGEWGVFLLKLTPVGTFHSGVTISVAGLPPSVTSSGLNGPIEPPAYTSLDVKSSASTAPGTYPITFTASGGGVTSTVTVKLVILAAPRPAPASP